MVAGNIKIMRTGLGLDQNALAAKMTELGCKMCGAQISRMERGLMNIHVDHLLPLALALGVEPADLLVECQVTTTFTFSRERS